MSEKTHVLIVDDDEEVRKTISRGLSEAGFSCEEAVDGRAGLEILRQKDFGRRLHRCCEAAALDHTQSV